MVNIWVRIKFSLVASNFTMLSVHFTDYWQDLILFYIMLYKKSHLLYIFIFKYMYRSLFEVDIYPVYINMQAIHSMCLLKVLNLNSFCTLSISCEKEEGGVQTCYILVRCPHSSYRIYLLLVEMDSLALVRPNFALGSGRTGKD